MQVSLPGELVESHVLQVHGRDIAVVELAVYFNREGVKKQGAILAKSGHAYRPGDIVTVERAVEPNLGTEIWVPVDPRKLNEMENAERLAAELLRSKQPGGGLAEPPEPAAPEIGSGPAAEPETTKKVLGPRRNRIMRSAPDRSEAMPHRRSVLGPRRSKITRQEATQ